MPEDRGWWSNPVSGAAASERDRCGGAEVNQNHTVMMLVLMSPLLVSCVPSSALRDNGFSVAVSSPTSDAVPDVRRDATFLRAFVEEGKLYFEVPASLVDHDFLIYQENSRKQQVLRWRRHANQLLLLRSDVTYVAASISPRNRVSRQGHLPPIIAAFPIEIQRANGAALIDVTRLFTTEVPHFVGASSRTDETRSFIERVRAFRGNVEIDAVQTASAADTGGRGPVTSRVHWSVVQLPTQLMSARLFDPRFGYWMETITDDDADYSVATRGSITRWRLEKADPGAAISDPRKPIVFYLDPETPEKWRPWIRKGIEAWQPAFEAAGFTNAILAADPPVNDTAWSVDDARHSVVRWYASGQRQTRGHVGGTISKVVDLRSGEILKANVHIYAPNPSFGTYWYFTMVSPLDKRAQKLPFPDSLIGRMVQFVVSHEVGHALGLRDGSYGKLAYPVDSLRSVSWLRRMNFTPSVMNYARFNYVAQPEDSIPPELLVQDVGPADIYSIQWGYTPIVGARTPEQERPVLEMWAQAQDTAPWLRFVRAEEGMLYQAYDTPDDDDPIRSTELGLRNLRRVMEILPAATLTPRSDHALLRFLYGETLTQWQKEVRRVVEMIGGFTVHYKSGSQPGSVYAPIAAAQQRQAMRFLDTAVFRSSSWLVVPEISRRLQHSGTIAQVMSKQVSILGALLDLTRLERIAEIEVMAAGSEQVYSRENLLADIRYALWSELAGTKVLINDPYRQELQRTHLMLLIGPLKTVQNETLNANEVRYGPRSRPKAYHLFRAELDTLNDDISEAITRSGDSATRGHLLFMKELIETRF